MTSSTSSQHIIELEKARVSLRADDIVQTEIKPEEELSLEEVKEVIQAIGTVSEKRILPQLIIAGNLSSPNTDAMKHIAEKGSNPWASCEAYVIQSLSQKILGNFYLKFMKPARPTRMFGDEKEAISWLEEQRIKSDKISTEINTALRGAKILDSMQVPTMLVSLRSDGLIQIDVEDGTLATLENVKKQIEAIGVIGKGKKFPVLILSGKDTSMNPEVMNFVATEGSNPYALAEAYMITGVSQKLLANFYFLFNKPARPTKVFTRIDEALQWLYEFRN